MLLYLGAYFVMPTRCVVAGCSNTTKEGVSLHRFPKDEKLRRIWTAKVRLTRGEWHGPSERSVLCSAHFSECDFESSLYSHFGMEKQKLLKKGATPSKIALEKSQTEGKRRVTSDKRSRKKMLDELLALQKESASSPDMSETCVDTCDPTDISLNEDKPGCSFWTGSSQHSQAHTHAREAVCTPKQATACRTESVATQTDRVTTRVKRVQATEKMHNQGSQTDPVFTRDTAVICKLLDNKEESRSDSETEEMDDHQDSPGYTPDSSESSPDLSSPNKRQAVNKTIKRK